VRRQERHARPVRLPLGPDERVERPLERAVAEQAALVQRQPARRRSSTIISRRTATVKSARTGKSTMNTASSVGTTPSTDSAWNSAKGPPPPRRPARRPASRAVLDDEEVVGGMGDMHGGTPGISSSERAAHPRFRPGTGVGGRRHLHILHPTHAICRTFRSRRRPLRG
jgi:hypothetical protein